MEKEKRRDRRRGRVVVLRFHLVYIFYILFYVSNPSNGFGYTGRKSERYFTFSPHLFGRRDLLG